MIFYVYKRVFFLLVEVSPDLPSSGESRNCSVKWINIPDWPSYVHLLTCTHPSLHIALGLSCQLPSHIHTPEYTHNTHIHSDLWVLYCHVMFHYRWGGCWDVSGGGQHTEKDRQTGREALSFSLTHTHTHREEDNLTWTHSQHINNLCIHIHTQWVADRSAHKHTSFLRNLISSPGWMTEWCHGYTG